MSENDWLYRRLFGRTLDEMMNFPTAEAMNQKFIEDLAAGSETIVLGQQADGTLTLLSEQNRENHMHILGATGTGKSKFLELLIRADIDRLIEGQRTGCCLIDPSVNGRTSEDVLAYCAHRDFERVCLINPEDFETFDAYPTFNPVQYNAPTEVAVGNILDAMHILYREKAEDRKRTELYSRALLTVLKDSHHVLPDSKYFLRPKYKIEREMIWKHIEDDDDAKSLLLDVVSTAKFEPIVNRFSIFKDYLLKMVLSKDGINFQKMIREGWLILVNLYPNHVWGKEAPQAKLVGTLIISQLTHAMERMRKNGYNGHFNIYVDEVGLFATPAISSILDYQRKAGLRLHLAHQFFKQIEDAKVLGSVLQNAKNKVLFKAPADYERTVMMKQMGYGGKLSDREVVHALSRLKKQQADIAIDGQEPRFTTIAEVKSYPQSPRRIQSFKEKLYSYEWFDTKDRINAKLNARFDTKGQSKHGRRSANRQPNSNSTLPFPGTQDGGEAISPLAALRLKRGKTP